MTEWFLQNAVLCFDRLSMNGRGNNGFKVTAVAVIVPEIQGANLAAEAAPAINGIPDVAGAASTAINLSIFTLRSKNTASPEPFGAAREVPAEGCSIFARSSETTIPAPRDFSLRP